MEDQLINKIPNNKLTGLFTFDANAAVESLKNPGKTMGVELLKGDPAKKPYIVVFRHGQSEDNIKRIHSGWRNETPLTSVGVGQAKELYLKLKNISFDYYFQSDQVRSQQTLRYAMGDRSYTPITEWRLKERNYGSLNGTSKEEALKNYPLLAVLWRRSWDYPPPMGESVQMVYYRVLSFIKELEYTLKKENASAVLSVSGNSMKALRKHYENLSDKETAHIENPTGQDYALYNLF
ncbi:hypothetical protein COV24_01725 [candidate division WWE3 bacterium CG10_big_fil_rev_8_21_14_0_10_32_10]|uniref:phosphoglycerate mutase (2,3-diphosphoglycerate-dependent) n=1 Tax=candidate division WWE3 bacterium CG10_big_fil_rev_8_21_14_0_10_32_10 TaxID=1975090 RepID=A0A2H0RAS6_UNCKA|nr:MAG: hypothetical protein COV24_01725 [candidate division WWE3 bacterium CG10_big_fil_rev_8_21_14_0_10_32_10]